MLLKSLPQLLHPQVQFLYGVPLRELWRPQRPQRLLLQLLLQLTTPEGLRAGAAAEVRGWKDAAVGADGVVEAGEEAVTQVQ